MNKIISNLIVSHVIKIIGIFAIIYFIKFIVYSMGIGGAGFSNLMSCIRVDECSTCRHFNTVPDYFSVALYPILVVLFNFKSYLSLRKLNKLTLMIIILLYVLPIIPTVISEFNLDEKYCRAINPNPKKFLINTGNS